MIQILMMMTEIKIIMAKKTCLYYISNGERSTFHETCYGAQGVGTLHWSEHLVLLHWYYFLPLQVSSRHDFPEGQPEIPVGLQSR